MKNSVPQNSSWQVRPVFISSTFKDMQAERTCLQHVVFPRLDEELRKGRILLEPIDLRQGVETADLANEADREQLVLKVVLEEVNRSHPFLIVLLGDRYGWVPPEERMAAATQEMGFQTDIRDKSVTALEIEFGILQRSPEQRRRSFFYFREPLPYDQMPPDTAALFSDLHSTDPLTRDRHARLAALKQLLTDDPELASRVHHYHADWDTSKCEVTGLEAWGEVVYQHLLHELQEEIAAVASQPPQTWEDQERAALAEFIDHRRRDFTGRKQLLDDLRNIALSPSPADAVFALSSGITWGACVTGEPGSGKSALFAELVARLSENESGRRIRETANDSVLLLTNAAGATPRGSQVEAMLDRFILELADALGIANPLPEKATPDDVDATFASLLGRVAVKRRVVVLLDALNQFDATPRARHMTWLRPKLWPANARIIATGLVSDATEALSQWAGMEKLNVPPLTITDDDTDDVTAIAQAVWKRYHRQMNPSVLRVLKEKRLPDGGFAAGNPLWLTLALEQINLLDADDFARADRDFADRPAHERVTALLIDTAQRMPPTVAELYDLLLAQSERLFGFAAARAFAAEIAVSRFGWRETDLLSLIPAAARVLCPDEPVPALDELRLAALRRSFRAHLSRRGSLGQLDFFHAQMRYAIERRTLSDPQQVQALHRVVADHLESLSHGDPLHDRELMHHLVGARDSARASRYYAGELSAVAISAATESLASHILLSQPQEQPFAIEWVYSLAILENSSHFEQGILIDRLSTRVSVGLENTGTLSLRLAFTQGLHEIIIARQQKKPDDLDTLEEVCTSQRRIGDLLCNSGDAERAMDSYAAARATLQSIVSAGRGTSTLHLSLAKSLAGLGRLLSARMDSEGALRACRAALQIYDRIQFPGMSFWENDKSAVLILLGNIFMVRREPDLAKSCYQESLSLIRSASNAAEGDPSIQCNIAASLSGLAGALSAQHDIDEAVKHYRSALSILERLVRHDPRHQKWLRTFGICNSQFGDALLANGDLDGALNAYEEFHSVAKRLARLDPDNAEFKRDLSVALERMGNVLFIRGAFNQALEKYVECANIRAELASQSSDSPEPSYALAMARMKIGDALAVTGNCNGAIQAYKDALTAYTAIDVGDRENLDAIETRALIYERLGDQYEASDESSYAVEAYDKSVRIWRDRCGAQPLESSSHNQLVTNLFKLASAHHLAGDIDSARAFESECYGQIRAMMAAGIPLTASGAKLFRAIERQFQDSYSPLNGTTLCNASLDAGKLNSLAQEASDAEDRGETARAMDLYQAAEKLARQMGKMIMLQTVVGNIGNIHFSEGAFEKALDCYREQELLSRQEKYTDGLARALYNQALAVSQGLGLYSKSMDLAQEAMILAQNHSIVDLQMEIPHFISWLEEMKKS